jgi:predicted dehydrogenase
MTQRRLTNLPGQCTPVAVYAHDAITDRYTGVDFSALLVPTPQDVIDASDLVIIATPHAYLADYVALASEANRRVFVEKPGGIPGDRLPGDVHVGYNHRFWPGIMAARDYITSPILNIRAAYGHGHTKLGDWRTQRATAGGGELLDQGSHLIDLVRSFDSSIAPVSCSLTRGEYEVESGAMFTLRTTDGYAQCCVSWNEWSPIFRFEIIAAEEKVTVEGFPWERQTLRVVRRDGAWVKDQVWRADRSLFFELRDAINHDGDGARGSDANLVLDIIDAFYL